MITVPGLIPWLRYVVYSSSEGPECHLSHHHNYLQINGKKCSFLCYQVRYRMPIFARTLHRHMGDPRLGQPIHEP